METCNSLLSIHNSVGATQHERLNVALKTNYFLLEERKEEDFILFVQKLSKFVDFYGETNVIQDNWSAFFSKESTSILIAISNWNIQLLQTNYQSKKNEVELNNDLTAQKNILLEFFNKIKQNYDTLLLRVHTLDDDITIKQNLVSSSYLIVDTVNQKGKLDQIIELITNTTDVVALMKSPVFSKAVQQLFGLLTSWKDFSTSAIQNQLNNYPKHSPHYTLLLTFLKLMKVAHEKLNEFTKRHLDFYYKEVLRIENQSAKPDYVHLVLEPYTTTPALIPQNTIFPAEENTIGQKKFYASTSDFTLNGITLESFLSIHFKNSMYHKADLFQLNAKNEGFNAFTEGSELFTEGFLVASPNFYLQSGERIIRLQINNKKYPANSFRFYLTGEEKTIEIIGVDGKETESEYIVLTIPATEKKIIPFDAKLHPEFNIKTNFPVLKIVPKTTTFLKTINRIEVKVSVNGFKSFVMDSDFGTIDTEKAFYPFGEFPKNGNGIIVSSNEFFMKKNAQANFYMVSDVDTIWQFHNKINTFYLKNGQFESTKNADKSEKQKTKEKLAGKKSIQLTNFAPLKEYDFENIASDEVTSTGKFRLELNNNMFLGEKFMRDFINASAVSGTALPYKPRVKEFIFDYTVEETLNFIDKRRLISTTETYHQLPFGYKRITENIFKFSQNNALEGEIYLGFKNVQPKDGLSLLIQLEEGTANPLLDPAVIKWKYLSNNIWSNFEPNAVGDETKSLTQSGLVSLTIPNFSNTTNTKLDASLFWIKIEVSNIDAVCKFIGVHTQALKAVLNDYEKNGIEFLEHTPKETISKTYDGSFTIKTILQPYASFGGKLKESDEFLYARSSERLRHKNRAITTWDYERIVLQEFPEVYRIKSLNHYQYDKRLSNVAAGYTTLIPIAKSNATQIINWKPLLSVNKMMIIKEFISKMASPHARINVKPPKLERVKVFFKVKYHEIPGMDTRLYTNQLIETLNAYLSPWAQESAEVNFASEIEFSSIIQLLDNQSFVDYITDFKVEQFLLNENNQIIGQPIKNLNKITPQTDFTLFVPNNTHQIQII
jgi:hypothetical protein